MNIIITLLTVLDVLIALLIIALVLVQQSKSGGGLGTTFGVVVLILFLELMPVRI